MAIRAYIANGFPLVTPHRAEEECNEISRELQSVGSLELWDPRIPLEIIEMVMDRSSIPTLKAWMLVCKALLTTARCKLFKRATIRMKSKEDAQSFIQYISQFALLISSMTLVRRIRLGGEATDGVRAKAWHAEVMGMMQVPGLAGVTHLTLDMRYTRVGVLFFKRLVEEARIQYASPLPNVRHFRLIGTSAIPANRLIEVISLFPRIETLKLHGLQWNMFPTSYYYLPFPPLLHTIEADVHTVLDAAVALLNLFDESSENPRGHIPRFTLRIDYDHTRALELSAGSDTALEAANHLTQILCALDRVVPTVKDLVLEVPMSNMNAAVGELWLGPGRESVDYIGASDRC